MDKNKYSVLSQLLYPTRRLKIGLSILIVVMMIVGWVFVYVTGGTRHGYLHVMYIPVILSAMLFGFKGGVLVGMIAGIALGPFMPLNTITMTPQSFFSWGLRMGFFMIAGGFIGYVFYTIRDKNTKLMDMYTHDVATGIATINSYWTKHAKHEMRDDRVGISLHINNYDALVVLLGVDEYSVLLKNIHDRLVLFLPYGSEIFLRDRRLFWIETSKESFKAIRHDFSTQMEKEIIYSETVPLFLDFSIGVSMPNGATTATERFKESDIAALHAKNNGVNLELFHDDFIKDALLLERLSDLPKALDNNEFFLVYQPIINLSTNKVIGIEALIRWNRDGKILSPDEFIPLAEETKLIDHITEWVLNAALEDYQHLSKVQASIEMAINVSYRNLFNPQLIERMVKRIKESNLDPNKLHIELTESTLMRNRTTTQAFLASFRSLGVSTILDDFGTGYSSLSCLRDLPVDYVKIDREFTMNIHEDRSMYDIISTIIDLAHKLDLKVIAEGVEEQRVLDELKHLGCDFVQGYYYSKPLDKQKLEVFIKKHNG